MTMVDFSRSSVQNDEIVSFLKREMQMKEVCQKILYQKVIALAAEEKSITVTTEEIQAEADKQRYELRLEKACDTLAWLADQMVTAEEWEEGIYNQLLSKKLAEHLFGKQVEKIFAQNRLNYDQVLLYQIVVPYEKLGREIYYQIEEEEISFYEAAHLYDIDEIRRLNCGYEGKIYRWNITPELAAIVFSAKPGELVGPVQTTLGYHLLMVGEFIEPQLTPEIYQKLINQMFKDWLETELQYLISHEKI